MTSQVSSAQDFSPMFLSSSVEIHKLVLDLFMTMSMLGVQPFKQTGCTPEPVSREARNENKVDT